MESTGTLAATAESSSASWREHVTSGREVMARLSACKWELGDLALAVATRYGEASLSRYAAEIGVDPGTLMSYRTVAAAYPEKSRRPENSWSAHQALAAQPDRADLLASRNWTLAQARELAAARRRDISPAGQPHPDRPRDDRTEADKQAEHERRYAEWAADPDSYTLSANERLEVARQAVQQLLDAGPPPRELAADDRSAILGRVQEVRRVLDELEPALAPQLSAVR